VKNTNECGNCKWKYPFSYLAPMTVAVGGDAATTVSICGVCALELSNKAIGLERTRFNGRKAEQMRLMAIDWRKNHRDLAPAFEAKPEEEPKS